MLRTRISPSGKRLDVAGAKTVVPLASSASTTSATFVGVSGIAVSVDVSPGQVYLVRYDAELEVGGGGPVAPAFRVYDTDLSSVVSNTSRYIASGIPLAFGARWGTSGAGLITIGSGRSSLNLALQWKSDGSSTIVGQSSSGGMLLSVERLS